MNYEYNWLMKFDINSEKCILPNDRHLRDIDKKINISKYIDPINSKKEKVKFLGEYEYDT